MHHFLAILLLSTLPLDVQIIFSVEATIPVDSQSGPPLRHGHYDSMRSSEKFIYDSLSHTARRKMDAQLNKLNYYDGNRTYISTSGDMMWYTFSPWCCVILYSYFPCYDVSCTFLHDRSCKNFSLSYILKST